MVFFLAVSLSCWTEPDFNRIINAIKASDVAIIAQELDTNLDLTMGDQEGSYTKAQAVELIKGFLTQHAPKGCRLIHKGSARDGASYYCIGSLVANDGEYRVYIFFKKDASGSYRIQEMRFEKE